jgi:hypothetical protein
MPTLSPDDLRAVKLSRRVAATATVPALPPDFAGACLPALCLISIQLFFVVLLIGEAANRGLTRR